MQTIRIGTRDSQLALWQANRVRDLLADKKIPAELVEVKSEGDTDLQTPLYAMGVVGIFTRALDEALLNGKIDLAVHSLKDVPTLPPAQLTQVAVLPRASSKDIIVYKPGADFLEDQQAPACIATSSIRRRAQWLHRYPHHEMESLRGNVNTRLRKLEENGWDGAIFAAAGLERIGLRPKSSFDLDWMLPAPAQGAICIMCRADDSFCIESVSGLNDIETQLCTDIERAFLRELLGGCSTPISGLAEIRNGVLQFRGSIFSPDGKQHAETSFEMRAQEANADAGKAAAQNILQDGGRELLKKIQREA